MIRNIIIVSIRSLLRYKSHSIINLLGLAIGIMCVVIVYLYVDFETYYDTCFNDYDQIYRVRSDRYFGEIQDISALSSQEVAPTLLSDFPQVQYATRFRKDRPAPIFCEEKKFYINKIGLVDLDFFDVFGISFLRGNPSSFPEPNTAVITQSMKNNYFPGMDPLNKMIYRDSIGYRIVGIIPDWPANSHIQFDLMLSWEPYEIFDFVARNPWEGISYTYIKVHKKIDVKHFDEAIRNLYDKYVDPEVKDEDRTMVHFLQPVTNIHLGPEFRNDLSANGNKQYLYLFSAIGVLILIIACINYMNLTTARFQTRLREIVIRKTVGADRRSLMFQFFMESLLLTFVAHIVAFFLVELVLPSVNNFLDTSLTIEYASFKTIVLIIMIILITGIMSGSYPALFLSGFKPASIMQRTIRTGNFNLWLRRFLVVFQFIISIALIIGVITINRQLNYMKNYSLGFDKENKLILRFPRDAVTAENYKEVKSKLSSVPGVNKAAFSSTVPGQWNYVWRTFLPGDEKNNILMNWYAVDEDFIDVMGLEIVAGRNFDLTYGLDNVEGGVNIINETAVKTFGWGSPEEALNKSIWRESRNVIGVIKDFHLKGLQEEIGPLGLFYIPDDHNYLIMDILPGSIPDLLKNIEKEFNRIFVNVPFYYFFLDQDFDKQYKAEEKLGILFTWLTLLGLFIAILGLLGLASFMAQQRTKEIGIRKVNGASVGNLVFMLIKDFTRWVLIANIVAWPVAFLMLEKWLSGFAYHTRQNIWVFFIAGMVAYTIAIVAVSIQAFRAANANPVDALKYE